MLPSLRLTFCDLPTTIIDVKKKGGATVNVKGDANRSVQKTKRRLREALVQLLGQKCLEEITVRELAAKAGISRGSFYFHYKDIKELMVEVEQAHLQYLAQVVDELLPCVEKDSLPPAMTELFRYLNKNGELCRALYGKHSNLAFTAQVKHQLADRCLGHMVPGGSTARERYLMDFAVEGCFAIIRTWQAAERDMPPERIAAITWKAVRAIQNQIMNGI